jgi:hypothetical protein
MARYVTTIPSTLSPAEAFAYMADFSNALHWDPSVVAASKASAGPVGAASVFELAVKFGSRQLSLRYEIVSFDAPRSFVVESPQKNFTSRDTVTVAASDWGSTVHYDAILEFKGAGRLLDPVVQLLFNRTGDKAAAGMRAVLNP